MLIFALNVLMFFFEDSLYSGTIEVAPGTALLVLTAIIVLLLVCLWRQPTMQTEISFMVRIFSLSSGTIKS